MREIKGTTRVCGLIGNPVEHSISPVIHNNLATLNNDDLVYTTFKVEGDKVKEAVQGAFALNVLGLNVTVPHKQAVIEELADIDPLAKAIGAVNTLVRTDKGYKGYNTDISGLERELDEEGVIIKDADVVILGAGGAARAIAFLCAKKGASIIYLLNRNFYKAEVIAEAVNEYFGKKIIVPMAIDSYNQIESKGFVAIQTTSVGLYPNVDEVVIDDKSFYNRVTAGVDIIYNPAKTKFMRLCEEAGKKAYNGLKMLLYQGVAAYELWNNKKVPDEHVQEVYKKMQQTMSAKESSDSKGNIVLIGFMGCGKSTFGKWISDNNKVELIDTDDYIVAKENRSINDIFAKEGEQYFRQLETDTIKELINSKHNCIISVGGGLPVREENRKLLKELGTVVYLETSKEELVRRLSSDTTRPLLAGGNLEEKIDTLMAARENIYKECADVVIGTENTSFEQMYSKLI